jgi:HEAT repeat protein
VLSRRRLVGSHPRAEEDRASLPAVRALRRPAPSLAQRRLGQLNLQEAAAEAQALAEQGSERDLADLRKQWADEIEGEARSTDYRERAVAYRAIGQFRFRQKLELLRRGLEDESPACRGSALVSLELLSRGAPGPVNTLRPLLHRLANADDNQAVRRLAVICLRNGSPQADTMTLLSGLAQDDRQERELQQAAAKVAATLKRKTGR